MKYYEVKLKTNNGEVNWTVPANTEEIWFHKVQIGV